MMKNNQWVHGSKDFSIPSDGAANKAYGCGFARLTFDADIGEEAIIFFREKAPFAARLEQIQPLTVLAHKGIVQTPYGVVAYVVWQIAAGTSEESFVETFLNPFQFGTLKLISDVANQTHLKFLAIDLDAQRVVSMVDFENTFDFGDLLFHMAMNLGHTEETQFPEAVNFIMANASVEDLVAQATI